MTGSASETQFRLRLFVAERDSEFNTMMRDVYDNDQEFYVDSDMKDLEEVDADREEFMQKSPNITETLRSPSEIHNPSVPLAARLAWQRSEIAPLSLDNRPSSLGYNPRLTSGVINVSVDYGAGSSESRNNIIEGQFWKLCPSFPLLWQSRFFILKNDGSIYYYYNRDDFIRGVSSRGVISLSDVRTELPGHGVTCSSKRVQISVYSKWRRTYYLEMNTYEEARRWERAIRPFIPKPAISREVAFDRFMTQDSVASL